ncbi:MAG: TrkH family potassium uptake protein [Sporomusaceae bacterium]|nr:TrkH family potassium uptake protein [Sporomusaceae bacterium]
MSYNLQAIGEMIRLKLLQLLPLRGGSYGFRLSSSQILVGGFAAFIFFGAVLLSLPMASQSGAGVPFIDALFTATSAVCVTGLAVVDTGTTYSLFGQIVLILLIQIGGLGIMTVATLFAILSGKRIRLRERMLIQEATNQLDLAGVVRLAVYIIKTTLLVECIGGTILAIRFYQDFGLQGIYFGYWHAVSSFCNAGFDLMGNFTSLTNYVDDWTINLTVAMLIIIGGIGFPVIADLWRYRQQRRLTLHTKVVLLTTLILIFLGSFLIFVSEFSNGETLGPLTLSGKIQASFFQSVSTRTAGYNTIDIGSMREGTLLIMILLMFIGASPSSMGGGIKTTTFAVLVASLFGEITGRGEAQLFQRVVPKNMVYKAFMAVMLALLLVLTVTIAMSFTEEFPIFKLLFDVVSGFGTVGLTMGITPLLTPVGKGWLILTMFAGRVGTLTLLMALAVRHKKCSLKYPEGRLLIG